jgi:small subunit ribosomal protein S18
MKVKTFSKTRSKTKRRERNMPFRKRVCRFCKNKIKTIDYKDIKFLESFITEKGKINSTRFSGNCARHQRMVAEAVKRARFMSLVPYMVY